MKSSRCSPCPISPRPAARPDSYLPFLTSILRILSILFLPFTSLRLCVCNKSPCSLSIFTKSRHTRSPHRQRERRGRGRAHARKLPSMSLRWRTAVCEPFRNDSLHFVAGGRVSAGGLCDLFGRATARRKPAVFQECRWARPHGAAVDDRRGSQRRFRRKYSARRRVADKAFDRESECILQFHTAA